MTAGVASPDKCCRIDMAGIELQQRCWNHEEREASCRCPACGRSYCRECVSEHEGRLLCAACLIRVTAGAQQSGGRLQKLSPAAMIAAAILLAWLTYWAAGESVMAVIRRMQQEPKSGAGASACRPHNDFAGVGQASHARNKPSLRERLLRQKPTLALPAFVLGRTPWSAADPPVGLSWSSGQSKRHWVNNLPHKAASAGGSASHA
jgi:hypothetical protein